MKLLIVILLFLLWAIYSIVYLVESDGYCRSCVYKGACFNDMVCGNDCYSYQPKGYCEGFCHPE